MSLNSLSAIFSTSDEATYYCAVGTKYQMDYRSGTCLANNGSSGRRFTKITLYQQPVSDPVYPGDSMTLQCTVLSETCTGEHSVYWFRAGSGESHPGVIYTPGNRSDECKKSPETPSPTQSCVYSLSENNLSPSHAGTYYCAVATCGEILFGKGTKLDVKGTFNEMGRSLVTLKLNYTAA
uniref:Ig-like domain-containing protein n=1 Tax=Oncorhynchus mykiss TaxID=8022 RepID=A0A8K9Y527_ONCMY